MSTVRRVAALTAFGATALALAGCSALGIEENTFESGPLPAISTGGAERVLAEVDAVVNDANAARDPELLASVFVDPLLGVRSATYGLAQRVDPEGARPIPDVAHVDPTIFIPQFAAYPQFFVVAATSGPDLPVRLEVLSRDGSAAAWFTSISADLLPGVEFPVLALDEQGYVVPVLEDEQSSLAATPDELAELHVAALNGGESTDDTAGLGAGLAADAWTVSRRNADAQRVAAVGDAATVTATYEATAALPQVLETADGGALVAYALTEAVRYEVQENYFLQLDEPTAALVGADRVTSELTESWAMQLFVYVPPDADGTPRVVAATIDRIGIAGS